MTSAPKCKMEQLENSFNTNTTTGDGVVAFAESVFSINAILVICILQPSTHLFRSSNGLEPRQHTPQTRYQYVIRETKQFSILVQIYLPPKQSNFRVFSKPCICSAVLIYSLYVGEMKRNTNMSNFLYNLLFYTVYTELKSFLVCRSL